MRRSRTHRYDSVELLRRLWTALPDDHHDLSVYVDRARSYRSDCGCSIGAVFVVVTLPLLVAYALVNRLLAVEHWFLDAVFAIPCLAAAAILGKLLGIGVARIRLRLLGRELLSRYSLRAE